MLLILKNKNDKKAFHPPVDQYPYIHIHMQNRVSDLILDLEGQLNKLDYNVSLPLCCGKWKESRYTYQPSETQVTLTII